jgi:ABC-type lipoprotein release transport system permease subunit
VLLLTGSLAALYPAWLASRADIATVLRAEAA